MKPKPPGYNETYPEKDYERKRRWYEANKEKARERSKKYYEAHKAKLLEYGRLYREQAAFRHTRAFRDANVAETTKPVRGGKVVVNKRDKPREIKRRFIQWLKEAPCLDHRRILCLCALVGPSPATRLHHARCTCRLTRSTQEHTP